METVSQKSESNGIYAFGAGSGLKSKGLSSTTQAMAPISILHFASPWWCLHQVWMKIFGQHAEDFRFVKGQTPLSTWEETSAMLVLYYAVIVGGREWMQHRAAYKLNTLFLVHNFCMSAISGGLLLLFLEQLIPTLWSNGLYDGICGATGWTDKLVVLYYLNYLTKYLEFVDTFFLFLKKKPLTFLHTYHHGATAALCFSQLVGRTPVSWVPITLNLFIHIVMYCYYFQAARGIKVWWKEWITRLQIAQFILDLGFVYFATYNYFVSTHFPSFLHCGPCAGEGVAALMGCGILSSYLLLFISFYLATYRKGNSVVRKARRSISKMNEAQLPTTSNISDEASELYDAAKDAVISKVVELRKAASKQKQIQQRI